MKEKRQHYTKTALAAPTADAAFAAILRGQRAEMDREKQKLRWAGEKKAARRRGKL